MSIKWIHDVYAYIYIYEHILAYICIFIFLYVYTNLYIYLSICTYVYKIVYIYTYIYVCICIYFYNIFLIYKYILWLSFKLLCFFDLFIFLMMMFFVPFNWFFYIFIFILNLCLHRSLQVFGNLLGCVQVPDSVTSFDTYAVYEGYDETARCVATFGGCSFSLDNALQLSSVGSCSATGGTLDLSNKNIVSLAPGVFTNMPSLQWVFACTHMCVQILIYKALCVCHCVRREIER